MNTSALFNPSRFAAVLRRDLTMQRNGWLVRLAAMLAVMILSELFVAWVAHNVGVEMDYPGGVTIVEKVALSFLCWFYVSLFTTLGASMFLTGWATPGERLNEIMSPASTLEKYASRFVISIVGVTVATLLCWNLSDCIRQLFMSGVAGFDECGHVSFIESCSFITSKLGRVTVISFLSGQAIYMLGSTVFPRHPFIKTMGAALVVEMIFGFVVGFTAGFFAKAPWAGQGHVSIEALLPWLYGAAIVISILFCYITGYYRMKEQEIIDRM